MVSVLQVVFLSILQGITEWLPVSSSGHLAIAQQFFGFQSLSFDVFLHLASLSAVFVLFKKDIIKLMNFKNKNVQKYLFYLFIALIPAGIVGFLFQNIIEEMFSKTLFLGIFFMFSGVVIYSTKFSHKQKEKLGFFDSIFIGSFQAMAVFPGISRSGFTIASSLFRGLKKGEAIKFSFLLSIPLILGAGLLKFREIGNSGISPFLLIISFIFTFLVSIITIKFLLKIINKGKFYIFGIYNFFLGLILLIFSFF